jgi:hypothetical protein
MSCRSIIALAHSLGASRHRKAGGSTVVGAAMAPWRARAGVALPWPAMGVWRAACAPQEK